MEPQHVGGPRWPWFRGRTGVARVPAGRVREDESETNSVMSGASRRWSRVLTRLGRERGEEMSRREENIHSVKRRIVNIRRQEDDAPVKLSCGFKSRTGWEMIRGMKNNQDSIVVLTPWGPGSRFALFAVLDGHGRFGHVVSIYVAQRVVEVLPDFLKTSRTESIALKKALRYAERRLEKDEGVDCEISGSTAVFVLLVDDRLFCANVGDSRAVLARMPRAKGEERKTMVQPESLTSTMIQERASEAVPVVLTYDHRPTRPDEKARLVNAGARVEVWAAVDVGEERVWLPDSRMPGLAVSRTFGDKIVKDYGVFARPEITEILLSEEDSFLIVASDGLWEYISNEDAVQFVAERKDTETAQHVAEALVKEATEQWIQQDNVIDDISVIVVYLDVTDSSIPPQQPQVVSTA